MVRDHGVRTEQVISLVHRSVRATQIDIAEGLTKEIVHNTKNRRIVLWKRQNRLPWDFISRQGDTAFVCWSGSCAWFRLRAQLGNRAVRIWSQAATAGNCARWKRIIRCDGTWMCCGAYVQVNLGWSRWSHKGHLETWVKKKRLMLVTVRHTPTEAQSVCIWDRVLSSRKLTQWKWLSTTSTRILLAFTRFTGRSAKFVNSICGHTSFLWCPFFCVVLSIRIMSHHSILPSALSTWGT